MDDAINENIATALDELESELASIDPHIAVVARREILILLMRNGLIASSRLHLDGEARALVEASRVLEARTQTH